MKPNFALNLSHDGIGLALRTASGWEVLGEVSLDAPNLTERLGELRRMARQRAPEGMMTKLVIPASQVLYLEIDAPGPRPAQRRKQIAAALEGRTPYAVEDLVFDWSGHGDVVQVAVVARETLAEAESFAEDWGFSPVALVSLAPQGSFAGEPWFGPSSVASAHLPEGARIEREQDSLALMAALAEPAPVVEAAPAPAPSEEDLPPAAEELPQPDALDTLEAFLQEAPQEPLPAEDIDLPGLEAALSAPLESVLATQPDAAEIAAEPEDFDATLRAALDDLAPPAPPEEPQAVEPAELSATVPEELPETPSEVPPEEPTEAEPEPAAEPEPEPELNSPALDEAVETPPPAEVPAEAPFESAEVEAPVEAPQTPEIQNIAEPEAATAADERIAPAPPAEPESAAPDDLAPPPLEETAAEPTFASRRPVLGTANAEATGATSRVLGGAARLHPVAAPEGKALFARSGAAGITAPGLALPDPPKEEKPALQLGKVAKAGLRRAAAGTVALGGSAGKAIAQNLRNRKETAAPKAAPKPAPKSDTPQPTAPTGFDDKTVFGGRKSRPVGGKPRHLGLALSLGLAAFLVLVALWSSFIGDSETQTPAPEQIASAATKAPTEAATLPAVEPASEPATEPPVFEPPTEEEPAATEPVPEAASALPEAATEPAPEALASTPAAPEEPAPSTPSTAPQAEITPEPAPEPTAAQAVAPEAPAPAPDTQLAALSTANAALPPLAPLAPLGSAEAPQPVAAPEPPAAPEPVSTPEPVVTAPAAPELQPTPEGTLSPAGVMLYAGRPPVVPPARPEAVDAAKSVPYADPALAGKRPKARPEAIARAAEAATAAATEPAPEPAVPAPEAVPDDGAQLAPTVSDAEGSRLASLRPKARPAAVETAAATAAKLAAAEAEQAALAAAQPSGSSLAVAVSRRPLARPKNFKPAVEQALAAAIAAEPAAPPATKVAAAPAPKAPATAPAPAVELDEPEPTLAAPKLPTSASVAKQATQKNALALSEINLIGLYGTSKNRRALVRLSNGRFVKVAVGDRLDGGKVTAIGETQLTYQKGSRSVTLKLLKGG